MASHRVIGKLEESARREYAEIFSVLLEDLSS
jgi:hypothetical protein